MRSVFTTFLLLAVVGAAAFYLLSRDTPETPTYTVELDNAFGLVEGADLKVAGVRAGTIKALKLDRESHRALVEFEITQNGFGSLREDAFCESRPQSLIGEYYIDCLPGTSREKLEPGAKIPVEQTASTIPLDLVNNVLRRPYRERLAIILDELGVGVAGRAQDINDVIRRASPALRETDKVLAKLARQNQTLKQLVTDADTVIGDLAGNKRDVGRWVVETKETSQASAERRDDIAAGLERLPTFLRELRPTMAALGGAADAQTPALRNLNASAGQLTTFLENLEPFSESTQVNMRSLAEAARKGRPAVKAAQPLVAELSAGTRKAPEMAGNAAIITEHLNDRKFAVEKDARSPGGQGYTGFEAILQWFFDNTMAINTYDRNGYILKINLFHSKCSSYQNPDSLKEEMEKDPSFYKDCAAILGPNQPGITTPDPTSTGFHYEQHPEPPSGGKKKAGKKDEDAVEKVKDDIRRKREKRGKGRPEIDKELGKRLQDQLGIDLPDVPGLPRVPQGPALDLPVPPAVPNAGRAPAVPGDPAGSTTDQLLDYLFGP